MPVPAVFEGGVAVGILGAGLGVGVGVAICLGIDIGGVGVDFCCICTELLMSGCEGAV